MRIAVTGAAGLIGGHVVRRGVACGHSVTAVIRASSRLEALEGTAAALVTADVLGPPQPLVQAFDGADAIIHTAATFAYGGDSAAIHEVATQGTANVLHAAAEAGTRRVVVTSSSVVFGYALEPEVLDESRGLADPKGQPAYVQAKIAQDHAALTLADTLGLDLVLACPTMSVGGVATTLGPSNGLITSYLADRTRSTFAGGCNIVSAADVGAAHILLAAKGKPGTHYILGSENLEWAEIHALVGVLTGVGGPYGEIGPRTANLAAGAEEWLARLGNRPAHTSREQAGMLGRYYWYRSDRAKALGFAPRSAAIALVEAVSWLASSRHISREIRAGMRLSDVVQQYRYRVA